MNQKLDWISFSLVVRNIEIQVYIIGIDVKSRRISSDTNPVKNNNSCVKKILDYFVRLVFFLNRWVVLFPHTVQFLFSNVCSAMSITDLSSFGYIFFLLQNILLCLCSDNNYLCDVCVICLFRCMFVCCECMCLRHFKL